MEACESCTNRHLAEMARANGHAELADRIEAAGCEWWWWKWDTDAHGNPTGKPYRVCGRSHLCSHMQALGALVEEASETIQKDRNEQYKALRQVDDACKALGADAVIAGLAETGVRAYLGSQIASGQSEGSDK